MGRWKKGRAVIRGLCYGLLDRYDFLDRWYDLLDRWDASGLSKTHWQNAVIAIIDRTGQWLMCKLRLCNECPNCETYVCTSCMKRVPWENGCADALGDICDDCWGEWKAQHD